MKKLLFSVLFGASSLLSFGQLDLSISQVVAPPDGSQVTDLQQVTSTFVVTNTGTTTLAVGDSIFFRNELDGQTQTYTSGGSSFNVFISILSKTLAPNDTVGISITLPIAWSNAGVTVGNSFTWGFNVRGTTCCPTVDDSNLGNNVASVTLNASTSSTIGVEETVSDYAATTGTAYFSNNELVVEASNLAENATVEVYNLIGQKVFEGQLAKGTSTSARYDLAELKNGIYIVKMSANNTVISSVKVMK